MKQSDLLKRIESLEARVKELEARPKLPTDNPYPYYVPYPHYQKQPNPFDPQFIVYC